MSGDLKVYYDALDRLSRNRPEIVVRGSLITFDNVALEAGKSKGAIKANRAVYRKLRNDILLAKEAQNSPQVAVEYRLNSLKAEVYKYKQLYEEAIKREISLYRQLSDMKDRLIAENEAKDKHKLIEIFRKKEKYSDH